MLLETEEVIAFAQTSFWLVIYNDPEAHGAADAAAGERIFSRADSDTWNHMYAGVRAGLWIQTWKEKKKSA